MVSIYRVPVDVLLIISVVCFIFRFKYGVDFVYLIEGCGKTRSKNKRYNAPHLNSMRYMHNACIATRLHK